MGKMTVHSYTVRKGESAQSVSEKFQVPRAALLRENETPFYEGQQVTVPVGVLTLAPAPAARLTGPYQVPETRVLQRPDATNIVFL